MNAREQLQSVSDANLADNLEAAVNRVNDMAAIARGHGLIVRLSLGGLAGADHPTFVRAEILRPIQR